MAKFLNLGASHMAIACCLMTATACGPTTPAETTTEAPAPIAPLAPTVATPDFVQKVAISDMYEVQAGQLANRRAQNRAIKDFAQQMVRDHTATTAQVTAIVHGISGLELPPALDEAHRKMLADLTAASAPDFDQIYVDQQTHAHQDALDLLQNYGQQGDNEALRAFATETAPKVQHHLEMVQALDNNGADEPAHP